MKYIKRFENFDFEDEDDEYVDPDWIDPTGTEWHKSSEDDVNKTINQIYSLGTPHPWVKRTLLIDNVSVEIYYFDGHLMLDFATPQEDRKKGNATRVLKQILSIADDNAIYVSVNPTKHTSIHGEHPNTQQIKDWFLKFGFTNIVYGNMERTPEISEDKFNELLEKLHKSGPNSLTKEDKDMMKRYSGDNTPVMDTEGKKDRINKFKSSFRSNDPEETEEAERIHEFEVDPNYTHFAIKKSNNKIVTGWDYKNNDSDEIKYYSKIDLKDLFPDNKISDFKVLGRNALKRMDIDPFNWDSWIKNGD